MLAASIVFFVVALVSFAVGVRAYSRIETAKEQDRDELRRITAERRKAPLAFVSYRAPDVDLATACAQQLEAGGYQVVKYHPNRLWDNPIAEVIRAVTTANAIVYVAGSSSDWIKAEIELAGKLGVPFFTVRDVDDLTAQVDTIRLAAERVDLVARLGCHHPHDREMLATKLIGAHTDDLEKDTARGSYARQWLLLGEIAGNPRYFGDRLLYVGGAFGCYASLAIAVVLLVVHLVSQGA